MNKLHIITPVKDSPETTLKTIDGIIGSEIATGFSYFIYNDFSTAETTELLRNKATELGFEHINLADLTSV